MMSNDEHLFVCLLAISKDVRHSYRPLVRHWGNVYSGPQHIFQSGCLFFDVELYEFLAYFGY